MTEPNRDYFDGIDPNIFRDMTKLGVQRLTELRAKFQQHEDLVHMLDEQTELLISNASLVHQQDNLKHLVRKGEMSDLVAAFIFGNITVRAKQNHDEICLNGRIISMMMQAKTHGGIEA